MNRLTTRLEEIEFARSATSDAWFRLTTDHETADDPATQLAVRDDILRATCYLSAARGLIERAKDIVSDLLAEQKP